MENCSTATVFTRQPETGYAAKISPEFAFLLASARTAPDAARMEALLNDGIDWRAFLDMVSRFGLRPLVYKSLQTVCWNRAPAEIQSELQEACGFLTGKNLFIAGEMLRIAAKFQAVGVPVAVLKGPVIAEIAYGDFALREFHDLDLLVAESDFPRTIDLLEGLGYESSWKCDNNKILQFLRHLGEYTLKDGLRQTDIDLHWRVAHKTSALSPDMRDFPSGFQPVAIAGSTVLSFTPQDLPLYLAAQGGCDQWCDLRRICDLAELIRRYPDIDWQPHLETAQRLGGLRAMLTGLSLASSLLGAALPEHVAARIHADKTVAPLTERIVRLLQKPQIPGAFSRYVFQLKAKQGLGGRIALAYSILMDRTSKDGNWIMLPRPLWWLYGLLRPLRMSSTLLSR